MYCPNCGEQITSEDKDLRTGWGDDIYITIDDGAYDFLSGVNRIKCPNGHTHLVTDFDDMEWIDAEGEDD